jgi:hypothetical protein
MNFIGIMNQFMISRLPEKIFSDQISSVYHSDIMGGLLRTPTGNNIESSKGIMMERLPINSVSPLEFFRHGGKKFKRNEAKEIIKVEFERDSTEKKIGG